MAASFLGLNRNKRSVALDLKAPECRQAVLDLVRDADVFTHNIRPQKLAKLGLDPDALMAVNPRLIYAGFHGYRKDGPYGGRPAYDDIIQGETGLADLMGRYAGDTLFFPTILADKCCGLTAAYAITAALYARERSGRGQVVEMPMFETMVGFNMIEHQFGRTFEPPLGEAGYSRVLAPWRRPFPTTDGFICVLAYTELQWRAFCALAQLRVESWRGIGAAESPRTECGFSRIAAAVIRGPARF